MIIYHQRADFTKLDLPIRSRGHLKVNDSLEHKAVLTTAELADLLFVQHMLATIAKDWKHGRKEQGDWHIMRGNYVENAAP